MSLGGRGPSGGAVVVPGRPGTAASGAQRARLQVLAHDAELLAQGKALRASVPRRRHGGWSAPPGRTDPLEILLAQNAVRLPHLAPVRLGRMAESPFAFFRGAAGVMAADLARTPNTGVDVHACGDAHLLNFGLFASPERTLLFDLNDFDETARAPWEWDLKRLAASGVVAARDNGFDDGTCRAVALAAVRSYRERTALYASMGMLERFYSRVDAATASAVMKSAPRRARQETLGKAMSNTSLRAVRKMTITSDEGLPRIVEQPPLVVRGVGSGDHELVDELLAAYRSTLRADVAVLLDSFQFADMALKVVGVGSVGTRCFIMLMVDHLGQPLFLQVKEAVPSVLSSHWPIVDDRSQGERVVVGQQVMQAASDVFLGWASVAGFDFYVRQLRDMKGSVDPSTLSPIMLTEYLELCGWALARAHAQSGRALVISGYLGRGTVFDEALADFALAYANQNEADFAGLLAAVEAGDLQVERGI